MYYQVPGIETYKTFPQNNVQPSAIPFYFIRPAIQRNDLDTVHFYNAAHQLVPLTTYLKDVNAKIFMVIRNDTILYERYADNYTDITLVPTFSISKSLLSLMTGVALASGSIKSIEDPITRYLTELRENSAFDGVTIKHLLNMQSGLGYKEVTKNSISDIFSDEGKYYYTNDIKKELRQLKRDTIPGTKWKYKSIDPLLLGWVLEQATDQSITSYFEQKIWKPIGSEYPATWGLDHENGLANTASKFQTTAIDLAKIGRLYLKKGNYNGLQIVPEKWVITSTSIGTTKPLSSKYWQQSAHHYLWWIPQQGNKGDYSAEGMGGQILYIDPQTNTIIVQFAAKGKPDYPYRKISRYLSKISFEYPK